MKNYEIWVSGAALTIALVTGGCSSTPPAVLPPATTVPVLPAAEQAPPGQASALSYGIVTSQVKKGETKQYELVQLFGSPNISTYDSAGIETWVYERTVNETDVRQNSRAVNGAANLGAFFGGAQAGAGAGNERSSAQASVTSSLRSITVIVKFRPDHVVADYSVRASYF